MLLTETENELYEWMQALTMWQNIRPQETKSTMPMVTSNEYLDFETPIHSY
jgi:hypothetical protein